MFLSINSFYDLIIRKSKAKLFPLFLAVVLMFASIILATPKYYTFNSNSYGWKIIELKSYDLTNNLSNVDSHSWLSKKVFRLTVPVIMRVTHLNPFGIIVLQYLLGLLLLVVCYMLTKRIVNDPVSATLVTSSVVFIYFGRANFYDVEYLWFDGFAFFSLMVALYSRTPFIIFLFCEAAAWVDERGLIALPVIYLFHQLSGRRQAEIRLKDFIRLNKKSMAVIFAIGTYLLLRIYLSNRFDMHTNSVDANIDVFKKTIPYLLLGAFTFLEGFWLIVIRSILSAKKVRQYLFILVIAVVVITFIIISGCVTDITRSGSYMVGLIFILLHFLNQQIPIAKMRKLLLNCFIISLLFPAYIVCADWGIRNSISTPLFYFWK